MDGGVSTAGGTTEDLECLESWWRTSGVALWSLILFGAVVLNSTLLLAFVMRPGLRTISNRFVMNLTVSNLLTCCILTPLLMLDTPISSPQPCICAIAEGATALVTTSSIFSVLLIGIDQYLAVVDPLRYRTRIDTLKCGILVTTVWLISLTFSLIAALNPSPKSLWLICQPISPKIRPRSTSFTSKNFTQTIDNLQLTRDQSETSMTYGLIYTSTFSLITYLFPCIAVCWIYISIYLAAHKNSKRTRRTGSRPILSSGNLADEYYPVRQVLSADDFQRIIKISSLSSIDESTETSPSQLPRHISDYTSQPSPIPEESSAVIFTVGSQQVNVTRKCNNDAKDEIKRVPISVLKAQFLDKKMEEFIPITKSKFQDGPDQRRKSSHDLMYEEIMKRDLEIFTLRHYSAQSDSSSEDDDENQIMFCPNKLVYDDVESGCVKESDTSIQKADPMKVDSPNDVYSSLMESSDSTHLEMVHSTFDHRAQIDEFGANESADKRSHLMNTKNFEMKDEAHVNQLYRNLSVGQLKSDDFFGHNPAPIVTVTPPKASLHRVVSTKSTGSYINSLKYRISNGSLFKYREESRAARVSTLVIAMSLICWTPFFIVLSLRNFRHISNNLPHEADVMALCFFISTTYISPMLFGYRSRRIKRELMKLFCFKRELSYKNNRSLMAKKVLKRRHSGNLSNFEVDNRCNILHCVYGKQKWPKDKVQFVQVPENALIVETCRSSFSSGASTQVSSMSTDDC